MTSPFDLRSQALSLAIATLGVTRDPERAAAAADILNGGDDAYAPQVPYPPDWVLRAQERGARAAAHAARYLDHAPTADTIRSSTKRHAVRAALADSEYLDPGLRGTWLDDPSVTPKLTKLLLRVDRQHRPDIMVEKVIDDLTHHRVRSTDLKSILGHFELTTNQADRLLLAAAGARHPETLELLVSLRLGHVSNTDHPFMRCSYSIAGAITETARRYGDDAQELFTNHVRQHLAPLLTTISRPQNVGVDDITVLIEAIDGIPSAFPHPYEPAWCFTSSAVDLLLDRGLAATTSLNILSENQFTRLLSLVDSTHANQMSWLCRQATSPARLVTILDTFEGRDIAATTSIDVALWFRHAPDASLELLERAVRLLHLEQGYIAGEIVDALPSPAFLAELPINDATLAHLANFLLTVETDRYDHLLTYIPGLAGHVLYQAPRSDAARRVVAILESSGLDAAGFAQATQLLANLPASLAQALDAARALTDTP